MQTVSGCHSCFAGMDGLSHWIPAFAGMTEGAAVRHSAGIAKGLSGWQQTLSHPHRHSGEGRNPGDRRHSAEGPADFTKCPPSIATPVVIPALREWRV